MKYLTPILVFSVTLLGLVTFNRVSPSFGAAITTINGSDTISASRPVINTNFTNLNTDSANLFTYLASATGTIATLGTTYLTQSAWYATTSAAQLTTLSSITSIGSGNSALSLANGRLGFATTSTFAQVAIHAPAVATNRVLISVASSTASATTSLFNFYNTGELVIGATSSPLGGGNRLTLVNTSMNGTIVEFQDSNGTCDGNAGAASMSFTCVSDGRLKTNVKDTGYSLNDLMKLRVRQYDFKADGSHFDAGLIAQETLKVAPEMVTMGKNGYYMVEEISPWKLVKAIQDLKKELDETKALCQTK